MKAARKFVIGSLVLVGCTLPLAYLAANRDEKLPRQPLPGATAGR
jgi:hypothetical protein